MIRIAITEAAFKVIAKTLPLGSTMYEAGVSSDGGRFIWLERRAVDQLCALMQRARSCLTLSCGSRPWRRHGRVSGDGGSSQRR
jgi:hypothetical protein